MAKKIKVGALISGGGTNLQAIIDACEAGKIDAKVVVVGSDVPDVKGLERARKHGIENFVVNYKEVFADFKEKMKTPQEWTVLLGQLPEEKELEAIYEKQKLVRTKSIHELRDYFIPRILAEQKILEKIQAYKLDLLVLAGFMRVLTPYFIDKVNIGEDGQQKFRIMNIHPALLPSFPGTNGYEDTFNYGCKVGGCTVHWIDYGEDTGPIIGQRAFAITDVMDLDAVKKTGLSLEYELFPECIQKFAEGKLDHMNKA